MATQGRRAADPLAIEPVKLVDRLMNEPYAFDFFQAVRLLHALEPGRVRVGRGGPPSAEIVTTRRRETCDVTDPSGGRRRAASGSSTVFDEGISMPSRSTPPDIRRAWFIAVSPSAGSIAGRERG